LWWWWAGRVREEGSESRTGSSGEDRVRKVRGITAVGLPPPLLPPLLPVLSLLLPLPCFLLSNPLIPSPSCTVCLDPRLGFPFGFGCCSRLRCCCCPAPVAAAVTTKHHLQTATAAGCTRIRI
jgi:hypothetical protein